MKTIIFDSKRSDKIVKLLNDNNIETAKIYGTSARLKGEIDWHKPIIAVLPPELQDIDSLTFINNYTETSGGNGPLFFVCDVASEDNARLHYKAGATQVFLASDSDDKIASTIATTMQIELDESKTPLTTHRQTNATAKAINNVLRQNGFDLHHEGAKLIADIIQMMLANPETTTAMGMGGLYETIAKNNQKSAHEAANNIAYAINSAWQASKNSKKRTIFTDLLKKPKPRRTMEMLKTATLKLMHGCGRL